MSVSKVHGSARDSAIAGIDLSNALFTAVALSSTGTYVRPTLGGEIYGVVYETAAQGRPATVALAGSPNIVKWQAGAVIATGGKVSSNAAGLAIVAASGQAAVGVARKGGAVGDIIEVTMLNPADVA